MTIFVPTFRNMANLVHISKKVDQQNRPAFSLTQEMQKQGRHYDYWGNDSLSVRQDNSENN